MKRLYKIHIQGDPFTLAIDQWFKDNGDSTLRLNYPLSEESVVFDVGGYSGQWSEEISKRYNPLIYIFEPVPKFFSQIQNRFIHNPKVHAYNFGLLDIDKTEAISLNDTGSSIYRTADSYVEITLVDIYRFLMELDFIEIDLIKINVEGAEYPILNRMIDTNIIKKCRDIQVQFHDFYPEATRLRSDICKRLEKTHFLTYNYPFVWENWRRK